MTKSDMVRKSLASDGLNQPTSVSTVSAYVAKSAEKKREIIRQKIKVQLKNGARYAISVDEWTCPGKRSRFLNIILHYMDESTNLGMDHVNGRLPAEAMKLIEETFDTCRVCRTWAQRAPDTRTKTRICLQFNQCCECDLMFIADRPAPL